MASKKSKAKSAPKAQIQDMTVTDRPALPAHQPTGKSVQATLLTMTGFAAAGLGLTLAIAPKLSWQATKIMVGFDYLGIHGGALVMGGLMLVGIAMVLRQLTQLSASLSQGQADTGLLESVASDVLQVGGVLEAVEAQVGQLKSELDGLRSSVLEAANQEPAAPAPEGLDSEDALFRLAASLDKVGAKIEERLKAQFSDLNERIDQVDDSLIKSVERVEELAKTAPTPAPMPAMPMAPAPVQVMPQPMHYPAPGLHQTGHHPAPQIHPVQPVHQTAFQPAPELHQTAYQQAPPAPPQEDPNSLGVLDHLDDDGVASPLPAPTQAPAAPFAEPGQGHSVSLNVPPPPAGRWGTEQGAPAAPNTPMTDPAVRAALEDMGRQG